MPIVLNQQDRFFPSESGLDPYLEWARATKFVHYFGRKVRLKNGLPEKRGIPVILELQKGVNTVGFVEQVRAHAAETWLRIPKFYASPPGPLRKTRYCTAIVGDQFLLEMRDDSSWVRQCVRRVGLCAPIERKGSKKALDTEETSDSSAALKSKKKPGNAKVLVGVIDDAIAFAHERFRLRKPVNGQLEHTTRVEYFWSQDGSGTAPDDFEYGSQLSKSDIDAQLGAFGEVVDEDEVYRNTRHIDFSRTDHKSVAWRRAHGTHVMDLACGFGPKDAKTAVAWPIVAVQLPVATTADTSGATLADRVLNGLDYILGRADDISGGTNFPIVVNLSYGLLAGPHDGSSIIERGIDDRIDAFKERLQVVIPSGNSHLSRCHATVTFDATKNSETLQWRVQPEDYTPSFLEIWLPHAQDGVLDLEIHIKAPDGTALGPITKNEVKDIERDGVLIGKVDYSPTAPQGDRDCILISLLPTATRESAQTLAPSGIWQVVVKVASGGGTIHAWIQRDDSPYGYARGARQSYFDQAAYQVYDEAGRPIETDNASYVKRESAINAIGTGRRAIVVGGFRRSDERSDRHSAGGLVTAPAGGGLPYRSGPDPDAMAVTDDSPGCRGVLAAGSRSSSTVAMAGTSVAAPQVARWIAEQMAGGKPHSRTEVCKKARADEAARPAAPPIPMGPKRLGDGRIALKPVVRRGRE